MGPLPTLKAFLGAVREIENWPEVVSIRLGLGHRDITVLSFRRGIEVAVRRHSQDWDIVRDLFLQSGYVKSFDYLESFRSDATVIDLGANIGCFSLLAAGRNEKLRIHAYEPGPPNIRILRMNCLLNAAVADRVQLYPCAAAGHTRLARWHYDGENPGASSIYGAGEGLEVQVRALADIVNEVANDLAMVKIDIEGAEYEMVRETPREIWERIPAVSIEVHRDPEGRETKEDLLRRFHELGYCREPDGRFAYFLQRVR